MSLIDEIRATTNNSLEKKTKDFLESKDFADEMKWLEKQIREAASKGQNHAHSAINVNCSPYNNDWQKFKIVKESIEKQGFKVHQTRCSDGFPYADHYDIWWN